MTPVARRAVVREAQAQFAVRVGTACRFLGVHRSLVRYVAHRAGDPQLELRLRAIAEAKPRWGTPRLTWRLRREGFRVNPKRIARLLRDGHLLVGERRRRRKRGAIARVPVAPPTRPDERWSMDFVRDTTSDGRPFRVFTLVDDFTRECPLLLVGRSLPARRIVEALDLLLLVRGAPRAIVCDNGPEFVSLALDQWATAHGVQLAFIRPGHPVENCFIESFNGRFRDEYLNLNHFDELTTARSGIEGYRHEYNTDRPHSGLGGLTPMEFLARWTEAEEASTLNHALRS